MSGATAMASRRDTGTPEGCCHHCLLPLEPRTSVNAQIDGRTHAFCCSGCAGACQLIHGLGLSQYYDRRNARTIAPALAEVDYSRYDEPPLRDRHFQRLPGGLLQARLVSPHIHCAACAWLIEHGLLPGLTQQVHVNVQQRQIDVVWPEAAAAPAAILAALAQLGYPAAPVGSEGAETLATNEQRQLTVALVVSGLGAMQTMMLSLAEYTDFGAQLSSLDATLLRFGQLFFATLVVVIGARPFISGAARSLRRGALDMNVPVALAILAAWTGGLIATVGGAMSPWFDSLCMFTFLLLLGRSVERACTRRVLPAGGQAHVGSVLLTDPVTATVREVAAATVRVGDLLRIRPGERLLLDADIVEGGSQADLSIVTGEAEPVAVGVGDTLLAGTLNLDQSLLVRATTEVGAGFDATLMRWARSARAGRSRLLRLTDRLASGFVAMVLLLAAATVVGWLLVDPGAGDQAFLAGLTVLIVSCPCALSLAAPTAIGAAGLGLARRGVRIQDADAIAGLARARHLVFDKTGTLSQPSAAATAVDGIDADAADRLARSLLKVSGHRLAAAFRTDAPMLQLHDVTLAHGRGVEASACGHRWRLGSPAYVHTGAATDHATVAAGEASARMLLARDGRVVARFEVEERLAPGVPQLLQRLRELGIASSLLSGDRSENVGRFAAAAGITEHAGDLQPAQKVARLEAIVDAGAGAPVLFAGDGLNDLGALASATVGIAAPGAAASVRARADIALDARIDVLSEAITLARRTERIIRQNCLWAIGYNGLTLPLAAAGLLTPWMAAIGMSLSSLLVTLNAARLVGAADSAATTVAEATTEGSRLRERLA